MDLKSAEVAAERRKREIEVKELLVKFRAGELKIPATPSDLSNLMASRPSVNDSSLELSATWKLELMYLLRSQCDLPIMSLCRAVGISFSQLPKHRRDDHELDQAIRDYQASWFEKEVEDPSGHIHPTLTMFGLKARAGWMEAKDQALSLDEIGSFVDKIGRILEEELRDQPEILTKISDRLLRIMPGAEIIDVKAEVRDGSPVGHG
jgi:hypothetical protein